MKKHAMRKLLLGSVALGSLVSLSGISWAGPLIRLAAEFDWFDSEATTGSTPDDNLGIPIYRKEVLVPPSANTLYLTLSTTGHAQNGATSCFAARIDDKFFNNPDRAAAENCNGAQKGWIALLKLPGPVDVNPPETSCGTGGESTDCLSNSITYQWCTRVKPGSSHEVEIRMATSQQDSEVSINSAHFYIDAASLPNGSRCDPAERPAG